MFKRIRSENGFTLVELLVVLAIMAILVAVVVPNLAGLLTGASSGAMDAEEDTVQTAIDSYNSQDVLESSDVDISIPASLTWYKIPVASPITPYSFSTYLRDITRYCYSWQALGTSLAVTECKNVDNK